MRNGSSKIDKALVIDVLYLIEWKHTLIYGKPLTNYIWRYSNRGPDIAIKDTNELKSLEVPEDLFKFVMEKVARLKYTGTKNLVFSTYPMLVTDKYDVMDLEKLEQEYKRNYSIKESKITHRKPILKRIRALLQNQLAHIKRSLSSPTG